jgi:hypothetical protein
MGHKITWFPRILITLIGLGLIFMGMSEALLGLAGERAQGIVTDIRREGGERAEVIPGRYTYNISYIFQLPDGEEISGFTKEIDDAIFIKPDGTSKVPIRYFPGFPAINQMEKNTGLGVGQVVLIVVGCGLILIMNRKTKKRESRAKN